MPRDVPGYHDVIKKPRCLEQIQRNLQRSKYASPAELLADVQLVWDNCREVSGQATEPSIRQEQRWADCRGMQSLGASMQRPLCSWSARGTGGQAAAAPLLLARNCAHLTAPAPHKCRSLPPRLQYNEPDAPVVAEAAEAEAYWRRCWAAAGIYVSQREMDEKAAAAAQARAAAEAGKLDSTWRAAARKVGWRFGTRS